MQTDMEVLEWNTMVIYTKCYKHQVGLQLDSNYQVPVREATSNKSASYSAFEVTLDLAVFYCLIGGKDCNEYWSTVV